MERAVFSWSRWDPVTLRLLIVVLLFGVLALSRAVVFAVDGGSTVDAGLSAGGGGAVVAARAQILLPALPLVAGTHLASVGCIRPAQASWRDWVQVAELPGAVARRLESRCHQGRPGEGVRCRVFEDFSEVSGVGSATFARISPLLCRHAARESDASLQLIERGSRPAVESERSLAEQ